MTRKIFAIALVLLTAINVASAQQADSKEELEQNSLALPVYFLRPIELREGVVADDFEAFVKNEFKNAFSKPTHGIRAFVVKGDRGKAKGEYKFVVVFDSKEIREKYFPIEDGDAAKSLQEDATPMQIAALQKLATFVNIGEYSDFAAIGD